MKDNGVRKEETKGKTEISSIGLRREERNEETKVQGEKKIRRKCGLDVGKEQKGDR